MITPKQRILSAFLMITVMSACASSGDKKKELTKSERARMLVEIANGALIEGDATGALEHLLRAEKEDPSLPELHHSKALAFYMKRDTQTALAEARKATELKPTYSDANNTLGKILIDAGQPEEAIVPLTRAANDPIYRDAYKPLTNLGIIYYRKGDYSKADQFLSRAILDSPNAACVAYYYRGHIRLRDSRFQDALGDYESAGKKMCASFADAHLAMGIAYERSKQYDLARKKFLEIGNRFPNTKVAEQAVTHLRFLP